jgi:hypothetical protein
MQWNDIIRTLRQIGHEVVIMDAEKTYVVMPIERFNELLDTHKQVRHLSEEELVEEINRQVAEWRAGQEIFTSEPEQKVMEVKNDEDTFYIEPV